MKETHYTYYIINTGFSALVQIFFPKTGSLLDQGLNKVATYLYRHLIILTHKVQA